MFRREARDGRGLIWFFWSIWSVWFNQTNETAQINKRDQPVIARHIEQFETQNHVPIWGVLTESGVAQVEQAELCREPPLQGCSKRLSGKAAGRHATENEVRSLFQQPI